MTSFGGFNNNTSKRILDELETVCLRLREIEVEGVAVIKQSVIKKTDAIFLRAYGIDEVVMNIQNSRLSRVVLTVCRLVRI